MRTLALLYHSLSKGTNLLLMLTRVHLHFKHRDSPDRTSYHQNMIIFFDGFEYRGVLLILLSSFPHSTKDKQVVNAEIKFLRQC